MCSSSMRGLIKKRTGSAFVSTILRPGDVPPSRRLIAVRKMAELSVHHHSADGSLGSMMVTELSSAHSSGSSSGSSPRSLIASSNRQGKLSACNLGALHGFNVGGWPEEGEGSLPGTMAVPGLTAGEWRSAISPGLSSLTIRLRGGLKEHTRTVLLIFREWKGTAVRIHFKPGNHPSHTNKMAAVVSSCNCV